MDLRSPVNCVCFRLRKAARAVTQTYDAALNPAGVTAPQFSLLAMLAARGPLALTALAGALGTDRTTLTRNLAVLERQHLLHSWPGRDRRERLIDITAAGRQRLDEARPLWQAAQARLVRHMNEERLPGLFAELDRLGDAAGRN